MYGAYGWIRILRKSASSRGRTLTVDYDNDSVSYASHGAELRTLDNMAANAVMSVYCNCGRIVVLDRSEMRLKLSLGKELECMSCRNARISREIDALNDHFNGVEEVDDWLL